MVGIPSNIARCVSVIRTIRTMRPSSSLIAILALQLCSAVTHGNKEAMILRGKCSWFGGPDDMGVSPDEGLAFLYDVSDAPHLFLPTQPPGTTGLARRLDPDVFYVATRWDYAVTPKNILPDMLVRVRAPKTGREFTAYCADWGPHESTGRVADLSRGLMTALGIETDDEVEVVYEVKGMSYDSIVISSGHGLYVRGASGFADEVDEARRVVARLADELDARGVSVTEFHDDTSKSQDQNLKTIVNFHNSCGAHDLDISVHFNAYDTNAHGTEVLYYNESALASQMSAAIAQAGGFTNRGGKQRKELAFLKNTKAPAILLEVCFCDNKNDVDLYEKKFSEICDAIANVLGGAEQVTLPPEPVEPPPAEATVARVDIVTSGNVIVTINGKPV